MIVSRRTKSRSAFTVRYTLGYLLLPAFLLALLIFVIWLVPRFPSPGNLADQVGMAHIGMELSNKDIYKINRRIYASDRELREDRLDRYVVGRLRLRGREFVVEVRNRGSFGYHQYFDRKSWRIRSPFNQMVFPGTMRYNISRSRYPHFEDHLAYTLASRIQQPAPISSPVLFSFNGDWQGVYHFSEQTDELFLRRHSLPYGPVYGEYKRNEREITTVETVWGRLGKSSDISPWTNGFEDIRNTLWQYLSLREQEETGRAEPLNSLLQYIHLDDELFERQTFDQLYLEGCLRWHAFQILLGSAHNDFHNLRLFYNPERDGFQLFTWDLMPFQDYAAHRRMPGWWVPVGNKLLLRLNRIPEYAEVRNRFTWELLDQKIPENVMLKHVDDIYPRLRQVYELDPDKAYLAPLASNSSSNRSFTLEEFDRYHEALKVWIRDRHRYLKKYLASSRSVGLYRELEDGLVQVIVERKADVGAQLEEIVLQINNIGDTSTCRLHFDTNHNNRLDPGDLELPLRAIETEEQDQRYVLQKPFVLLTEKKLIHIDKAGKGLVEYSGEGGEVEMLFGNIQQPVPVPTYFSFLLQTGNTQDIGKIRLGLRNSVTHLFEEIKARRFVKITNSSMVLWGNDRRRALSRWVAAGFPVKPKQEVIVWKGQRTIDETFIVSPHQTLKVYAGTTVRFSAEASLMVFGRIEALGTEAEPVLFSGKEAGVKDGWGVIAINNGEGVFKNVIIDNGGEATIRYIPYSGALSAYCSIIKVQNTILRNSRGDDGINVKYGQAEISNSRFESNIDAIDCDYSTCTIKDSDFIQNRNDAIDIGSSFSTISANRISGSGDKGISIGGYSTVEIEQTRVSGSQVGLAVKDGSMATVATSSLHNNKIGAVLFVKNKDFKLSVPTLNFISGEIRDNKLNFWKQENTMLVRRGGNIALNDNRPGDIGFDWEKLYQ